MAITIKSYETDAIANEFLSLPDAKGKISQMKLQKLVYYAHGWRLAIDDVPLVSETVQAWRYGPVFRSLYSEFKDYGKAPISRLADEIKIKKKPEGGFSIKICQPAVYEDDERTKNLVKRIWERIGHYTASQLSSMTHKSGSPWHQVASEFGNDWPRDVTIPNELIKAYFQSLLQGSKA